MIRKLRWKVVGIVMLVVTAVFLAVFAGAYSSTRSSLQQNTQQQLQQALQYGARDSFRPGADGGSSLPCFVAEVYPNGTIHAVGSSYYQMDDTVLRSIVQLCMSRDENSGVLKDYQLRYLRQNSPMGLRIAFTDSSLEQKTLHSLMRVYLLIGLVAIGVLFACSWFLSGLVTKPVEKAWQEQQRFLSDASHELKTPLTVILSSADLLAEQTNDERGAVYVDNIRSESQRMRALVEDMLTLSRAESGKQLPFSAVDLSDLAMDTALRFEPVAYEAGRTLLYDIQEDITVQGDAQRLRQLQGILLDNAIKYAPAGSEVRLTLHRTDKSAVLTVENGGEPIPAQHLPHIFERFYRADSSRSDHGSFGLGLPIAQSVAHSHGGEIRCRSDARSTCFTVTLPLQ